MKYTKPLIASAILIGLMLAASAWAWPQLGDQPVAIHFGLDGRPNGYAPKTEAVLAMPGTALLLSVLFTVLPVIMPAKARLERSWAAFSMIWISILTLLLAVHLAMLALAVGLPVNITRVMAIGLGAFIAILGNLLGKVRYNYVLGVRTPWTLSSERVWDRTHRFAGRVMAVAGLLMVAAGVAAPAAFGSWLGVVVLVGAIGPAIAAVVYSYLESRREERGLQGQIE